MPFCHLKSILAVVFSAVSLLFIDNRFASAADPDQQIASTSVVAPAVNSTSIAPAGPRSTSSVRSIFRTAAMQCLNRSGNRVTTKYGITLDDATSKAAADRPFVIVIHGYNSCPQRMAAFSTLVRTAGYPCGTFGYPNDQSVAASAGLLSSELTQLKRQYPNRRIVLLTHSMGGLVARETVENPAIDPGNVSQLIMISPPSQGTSWAYIACSGDFFEYGTNNENCFLDRVYCSLEDGFGEARYDLQPNSAFLKALNERPRNKNVKYSIFLGTGTKFSRAKLEHAHQVLDKCCEENRFLSVIKPALDSVLCDMEDAVQEGDGVVSIARGKLDGVDDITVLGFDHWNVIRDPQPEPVAALHCEILSRLGKASLLGGADKP
jgi:hypothetical protein